PRDFREDTRMPHFYGLSTNSSETLPPEQKKFPDAEIHGIAYYLFSESKAYLKDNDTARKALVSQFNRLQSQMHGGSLTLKERKELIDVTRRLIDLGLTSRPDRAAEINAAGGDLKSTHDRLFELLTSEEMLPARKTQLERRKEELDG